MSNVRPDPDGFQFCAQFSRDFRSVIFFILTIRTQGTRINRIPFVIRCTMPGSKTIVIFLFELFIEIPFHIFD